MNPINKRHFLLGTAGAAAAASPGLTRAAGRGLAGTRPRLDERSGPGSWQAYLGQTFEIAGQPMQLHQVQVRPVQGEQFSLGFRPVQGAGPAAGLQPVSHAAGAALALFLVATPGGLRADFARC